MKLYWVKVTHESGQASVSGHRFRFKRNARLDLCDILRRNGWLRPDAKVECLLFEDKVDFWTWLLP